MGEKRKLPVSHNYAPNRLTIIKLLDKLNSLLDQGISPDTTVASLYAPDIQTRCFLDISVAPHFETIKRWGEEETTIFFCTIGKIDTDKNKIPKEIAKARKDGFVEQEINE